MCFCMFPNLVSHSHSSFSAANKKVNSTGSGICIESVDNVVPHVIYMDRWLHFRQTGDKVVTGDLVDSARFDSLSQAPTVSPGPRDNNDEDASTAPRNAKRATMVQAQAIQTRALEAQTEFVSVIKNMTKVFTSRELGEQLERVKSNLVESILASLCHRCYSIQCVVVLLVSDCCERSRRRHWVSSWPTAQNIHPPRKK
jgi:hypothetical protein